MKTQVMLDLETFGTKPGSVIVAIGAVKFDPNQMNITDEFYRVIDPVSAQAAGLTLDAATVKWWLTKSDPARVAITANGLELTKALGDFQLWLGRDAQVWGNGASFDAPLLTAAYKAIGKPAPWAYWDECCYRTLKNLVPQCRLTRTGTHHNALDDAKDQAIHLMDILKWLNINL